MGIKPEVGCVVWHDLMTHDVVKARHFYGDLLGWDYQIEHASEFVWQPGEAEYPLIMARGEAHGGFVDAGHNTPSHWLAYVMVNDVDAVTTKAKSLGGFIDREPFETPKVGRSSVLRDPQGAVISAHCPAHSFPAPGGIFLWDELVTSDVEPAKVFYGDLFGWRASDIDMGQSDGYTVFKCADDTAAAGATKRSLGKAKLAVWIPYLATDDIDATIAQANVLGAHVAMIGVDRPNMGRIAILVDPVGALFGLSASGSANREL